MIRFDLFDHEQFDSAQQQNIEHSDMTLSFSASGDFATAAKVHHNVDISKVAYYNIQEFAALQKLIRRYEVKVINITGSTAYDFKTTRLQPAIDDYVRYFLKTAFIYQKPLMIRSDGQSGAGEAGLKFGDKHGIKTVCTAESFWAYRNDAGKVIKNESEFKCRFGLAYDLF